MATYPTTAVQYGQTSNDVKTLQTFLISQGMSIPAGATGYFGDQTKAALTQWQTSQGITGAGIGTNWGPQSIAKASAIGATSTTSSPTPTPSTSTSPAGSYAYSNQTLPGGMTQQQLDNQRLMQQYTQQYGGYTINPDGSIAPKTNNISPVNSASANGNTQTSSIPGLPAGMENLTVSHLPNEAFSAPTASTQLMPGTPEYQAAMDKLDTSFYDVMQQQMTAQTEEQQQAAEYSWQTLKSQAEATLGVNLSNNAMGAWTQIQGLKNNANPYFGGRNITGSGLENQSIDTYLQSIRSADASTRTNEKNTETANQMNYYKQYATPEQINELVQSNPSLAQQWGLVPSSDIKNQFNAAALKAKYPSMSDSDIQAAIATVLDENGNYRSNLYQKYMVGNGSTITPGNVGQTVYDQYGNPVVTNVNPGNSGILDIKAAEKQYQTINTPYASQAADANARRALGSTPPSTSQQTQSNPVSSTQFTPVPSMSTNPSSSTPPPGGTSPTIANPIPNISNSVPSIPPKTTTPTSTQNNPLSTTTTPTSGMYTVKKGDNLWSLYGPDWKTISGYTGDPTKLQVGTLLPMKGLIQ